MSEVSQFVFDTDEQIADSVDRTSGFLELLYQEVVEANLQGRERKVFALLAALENEAGVTRRAAGDIARSGAAIDPGEASSNVD